jgi:UDP-N-acetylmuramate dehydrogenase
MNTLRLAAKARFFAEVTQEQALVRALDWASEQGLETLILGGGSNLVLAGDFDGLVIRMAVVKRQWEDVSDQGATLVLGAGEHWHDVVLYAAGSGYRGIENLALIPGTCGAAPVQNIGAYGVELKDTLVSVKAWDREHRRMVTLDNDGCQFAYRDSVFKRQPQRYVIVQVKLRLSRTLPLALGYGDLMHYFSNVPDKAALTALDVAEGVMAVRRRKLPDPQQIPNAGSFFKNPVVSLLAWEQLKAKFPDIAAYPGEASVKLAAGWLIDQCGWKGYRNDKVGVHNHQALVLINHSNGTGKDILALAERITADVANVYGVALEIEPGIVSG